MLAAFDTYARLMQRFSDPVIEWDISKQSWIYHRHLKTTIVWYYNILIVNGIWIAGAVLLLISRLYGNADPIPLPVILLNVMIMCFCSMGVATCLAATAYGDRFISGWTALLKFNRKLQSQGNKGISTNTYVNVNLYLQ